MEKQSTKYVYLLSLLLAAFIFLINLISDYIVVLTEPAYHIKILIYLIDALFLGTAISIGLFVINPTLSQAMATLRRMLRVENLSNPLLSKLSSEAPGTYHHSLNVSTLAQKAAKAIGADPLLVRTAAYYHDIGKLDNPFSFVENQSGGEVPTSEDSESIRKNARIIIAHVDKGAALAKKYDLPAEIIDMIREHHGTTRALYFYRIAKEKGFKIKKTDFRYLGTIPQSRESAILMISDCVEAWTRAYPFLTKQRIKEIVSNTIDERLKENQFRGANLTKSDLTKIARSLEETLLAIYHHRIDYGAEAKEE